MTAYFLDSSALAKHYCQEAGSQVVDAIFSAPQHLCIVSRLTIVEIHSVFATKVRRSEIVGSDFELLRRRLLIDGRQRLLRVASMTAAVYSQAVQLLRTHALGESLRTLDALQLAVAVQLRSRDRLDFFVTADKSLASVAARAGLAIINPEST